MDSIVTVAELQADTAKSVAKNVSVNMIEALGSLIEGKKEDGLADKNEKRFSALRHKLFLKFTMIDYEILLSRNNRNDMYAQLMEGNSL